MDICQSQVSCGSVDTEADTRDRRWDRTKLKIVQYNAEWLFVDDCNAEGWNAFLTSVGEDKAPTWTWGVDNIATKAKAIDKTEIKQLANEHLEVLIHIRYILS